MTRLDKIGLEECRSDGEVEDQNFHRMRDDDRIEIGHPNPDPTPYEPVTDSDPM